MLEKIGQIAEQAATSVSRRQLLGRLGRGAMALAVVAGGMLAFPGVAAGKRKPPPPPPPPAACGADSDNYCLGLVEGAYCQIGTTGGVCRGAPSCYCAVQDPRGRRQPRR